MVTNFKSTVTQIKRLVGRKYDEPSMASEFAQLPYTCIRMDNGDIGIKVCVIFLDSELRLEKETETILVMVMSTRHFFEKFLS